MTVKVKPTTVNPVVVESATAFNAHHAYVWAEGTDEQVEDLGGGHSAKKWAELAEQAASSLDTSNFMEKTGGTFTGDVTFGNGAAVKFPDYKISENSAGNAFIGDNSGNGLVLLPNGEGAALFTSNGTSYTELITGKDVKSVYSSSGVYPLNGVAVASAISGMVKSTNITNILSITSAGYDELTSAGTVDANTLYVING